MFFFWMLVFCLVFQAFFLLQKKLTGKKHIGNVSQLLSYHPIFPVTPLGPTKNPRPWDLAFTLWASFSQVSWCLALHCGTMKEMILESVVRWWNRQTPSTLHRVWACSRLRCHKWFPRMFFFCFACFVFRNGPWKKQQKTQHFLTHLGILRISGCHQHQRLVQPTEVASCFDWDPRAKLSSIQETALRKCLADTSKAILWDYEDDVGVAVGSEASVNEGKEYTLLKCNKYVVELWLKKWRFHMDFCHLPWFKVTSTSFQVSSGRVRDAQKTGGQLAHSSQRRFWAMPVSMVQGVIWMYSLPSTRSTEKELWQ